MSKNLSKIENLQIAKTQIRVVDVQVMNPQTFRPTSLSKELVLHKVLSFGL
jgi:hypothetical protein